MFGEKEKSHVLYNLHHNIKLVSAHETKALHAIILGHMKRELNFFRQATEFEDKMDVSTRQEPQTYKLNNSREPCKP